jgi:hypothetical protein
MAMLPAPSIAALPIQREAESGAKVPCWNSENAAPAEGWRNSYQRTPTLDPAAPE